MNAASSTCRVVICDDVPAFRTLVVTVLERADGLSVVGEAANGEEAIAAARAHQPDVVLLDVAMPIMDGIEALPHIRIVAPGAKVILLSGFSNDALRQQALAGGAIDYLEKGTRPADIVAAIRAACCA